MTLDEVTVQLNALYHSGQKFRFIQQVHQILRQVPSAPDLAELLFGALLEQGWGGPARELLQMRPELRSRTAQRPELLEALAQAPNGRVPWGARAETYRQNVAALLERRPHLRDLVAALPATLTGLHLYQAADGRWHVSRRAAGGLREWLPSLAVFDDEMVQRLPPRGQVGPTVIFGVRLGVVLEQVYARTHRLTLSYSHPLYVVEPDPARFAAWLHCVAPGPLLHDPRVYYFVGADAAEQLAALLEADAELAVPVVFVDQSEHPDGSALVERVKAHVEQVIRRREAELARCMRVLRDRYAGRDTAYWAAHLRPPGRVLGITSRFTTVLQYSTRDALRALGDLGYEPHVLLEPDDHHHGTRLEMCRRVLELDPAFVLILDHVRCEYQHFPPELPILTWIQDPLDNLLSPKAGASIGPFDFVCGYYRDRCVAEFGYPADAFHWTAVPVSTHVFHDAPLDPAARAARACDVCFVSNTSEPLERFVESALRMYPDTWHALLKLIYARALDVLGRDDHPNLEHAADALLADAVRETGTVLRPDQQGHVRNFFAYRVLDWGRRQQTLEWVGEWARRTGRAFRLYGRGWEDHPTLAPFAAGVLEHGEPLRQAYRAATLSLQLIPGGFGHQRSYELLAAGTLPLTRYCPADFASLPIETYVQRRAAGEKLGGTAADFPGLERVVFRSRAEFESLAERFLADAEYRRQVQGHLRAVVLERYTYAVTLRSVMDDWQARLARLSDARRGTPTLLESSATVAVTS